MAEFEINGVHYRSGKMNAFQQFHVARKLGPILARMGTVLSTTDMGQEWLNHLEPLIEAIAQMPEEDCNYVLYRCLAVVARQQGPELWSPVWSEQAKRLMFEDIDLAAMIQITINVLGDNLSGFFNAPQSNSTPSTSTVSNTPVNSSAFPTAKTG